MLSKKLIDNSWCVNIITGRSKFLKYATGSAVIPPLGLKKIKVRIVDGDGMYAATCVNALKIPNFDEEHYETFKVVMDSIISSDVFTSM